MPRTPVRAPVEEHISAAQVALLERGVEILAARPPLGEPEMRSHCRAMDDAVALELSPDGRGRREVCGRQLAIGLAAAVLVATVTVLQLERSSPVRGVAPVVMSTSILASSQLDWLGGGVAGGDPYAANSGEQEFRAHLAPAALSAASSWKQTLGTLFGDALAPRETGSLSQTGEDETDDSTVFGANYPQPPRDVEPAGRLLSAARRGQRLWQRQIREMQSSELRANREVMEGGPSAAALAAADPKADAHARLSQLAAKHAQVARSKGATAAGGAVHTSAVKGSKQALAVGKKGSPRTLSQRVPATKPTHQQLLKSVTVKPDDLTALDVATSDTSRNEMTSFFDSLAARDEAKHVLHEARYPRSHSMRKVLPTTVMKQQAPMAEMKHMKKEVTWLRKRVEVLQDAIVVENKLKADSEHRRKKTPGAAKTDNKKGEVHRTRTPHAHLNGPPPRGCPLFAAPGEQLPSYCPRVALPRISSTLEQQRTSSAQSPLPASAESFPSYLDEADSR